jgi:hypothetical protein
MRPGLLSIQPGVADGQNWARLPVVDKFQQYEVWQMADEHWDLVSSFPDFDPAYAITRNRKSHVRLLKVTYQQGHSIAQEVIAEVGEPRTAE